MPPRLTHPGRYAGIIVGVLLTSSASLPVRVAVAVPIETPQLEPASAIGTALRTLGRVIVARTSIAATYAAAHTVTGTGGPQAGLCVNVNLQGFVVVCRSSDFFAHQ